MLRIPVRPKTARSRWAVAPLIAIVVATLAVRAAFADRPSYQLADFYYADGTLVTSANGEPDDAALLRYSEHLRTGVEWQFMTQHLTPGARYDVWIHGSNDGTDEFLVWAASAIATVRGEINAFGFISTGGSFANSNSPLYLVITDGSGEGVQEAFFPAP